MSQGGSRWFLHRREGRGPIRGLVSSVVSVVPHLDAGIILVWVILLDRFIQNFMHLTVLLGVTVLLCLTMGNQHSVHIQLLSVHHHSRVTTAVIWPIWISFSFSSHDIRMCVMSVGTLVTSGGIALGWRVTDLGRILVLSYRHRLLHRLLSQLEVGVRQLEVEVRPLEVEVRPLEVEAS